MRKILKGDNVVVTSGSDKGKKGLVLKVQTQKDQIKKTSVTFVWVAGANLRKINKKKAKQQENIMQEFPLNISKVAYWDVATNTHTKIGFKFIENGKKIRYCKASNKEL